MISNTFLDSGNILGHWAISLHPIMGQKYIMNTWYICMTLSAVPIMQIPSLAPVSQAYYQVLTEVLDHEIRSGIPLFNH